MDGRRTRVLIAKPGLDGHDRGAKVVAYALRDAGMEVIYTGLRRTVEDIAEVALQEDVDAIGLSILSGAHLPLTRRLKEALGERANEIAIVVGGTIAAQEIPAMLEAGASAVFPTGTALAQVVAGVRAAVEKRNEKR
ncbi:MAG: cobalamin B12-binding domain-containing protein [Deltaproteobacteria bacterium]|jgi:methylmalonyl-CoA mutase, C-terminal domain|nr:cobalamin B12-binding domain-containing protein [Deltaproteobacteria bacterium]